MPTIACPKCGSRQKITDEQILAWILEDETLRRKTASAMGRLTGGQTKLNAAQRRARALKAVQAREAKRAAESSPAKPAKPSKRRATKKPKPAKKKSPPKPKRKPAPKRRKK